MFKLGVPASCQQPLQPRSGLGLKVGQDMRVRVQGDADARVTETLGDDFGVRPADKHERGVDVAKVMP